MTPAAVEKKSMGYEHENKHAASTVYSLHEDNQRGDF